MFKITADEARELSANAKPADLERARAIEDAYSIIRGDAKRGQRTSVQQVFGDRQKFLPDLQNVLEVNGFSVAFNKIDDRSTIMSVSWN